MTNGCCISISLQNRSVAYVILWVFNPGNFWGFCRFSCLWEKSSEPFRTLENAMNGFPKTRSPKFPDGFHKSLSLRVEHENLPLWLAALRPHTVEKPNNVDPSCWGYRTLRKK